MSEASERGFYASPETLRAASRLGRHAEWSEGFWLAYIFTISPPQAHILQEGLGAQMMRQGRTQRVFRPETPSELEHVLAEVLADGKAGCTWDEAVRGRTSSPAASAWADAWLQLILRTNERRELIRETLQGGLVFVAHPDFKPDMRQAGPDLWSIRSFAFDIPAGPNGTVDGKLDGKLDGLVSAGLGISGEPNSLRSFSDSELLDSDLARLSGALAGQELENQARIKERLADRLAAAGRHEEALEMAEEIVDAYRGLAKDRPDVFLPDLAMALNNLGIRFSGLGRREEAVKVAQEAVDSYRGLAKDRPDAFLPDLAMALTNLGSLSSGLGRREEAVEVTQEAVDTHRGLAKDRPDAVLPDLAKALNNLGNHFSDLGRREEAMKVTQEAVETYRGLAKDRPDEFLPDLAMALTNLGNRFNDLGRLEEGMKVTQEAVETYRGLAKDRPDALLPDLAAALNNLGIRFSNLGRQEEAMKVTHEAVDIRRGLAKDWPDAFLPDLATSLGTQGSIHEAMGSDSMAAGSFAEGLRCLLPLYQRVPEAFVRIVRPLARDLSRACHSAAIPIPEDLQELVATLDGQ
ncbi:MAG: tetratricopeptide repeat protein [Nannocystaceae bacterium]|nr:tetratricopeptide repeat protein [Nannocystaceae bacterium]